MKITRSLAFVAVATVTLAFAASGNASVRPAQTVHSSPALVAFLDTLSEVASGGASLAYFGWTENAEDELVQDCSKLDGEDVVAEFERMARDVIAGGDGVGVTVDPVAVAAFAKVVGTGRYEVCYASGCGNRACTNETEYRSLDTGYRVRFEIGYED